MKTVRPKPGATPSGKLPLTPEEYFVLSRIDGRLSVRDLVALTGLDEPRVEQIVTKLASHGAVMLESTDATSGEFPARPRVPSSGQMPLAKPIDAPSEGTTTFADLAAALGLDPSHFVDATAGVGAIERPIAEERIETNVAGDVAPVSRAPEPSLSEPPPPLPSDNPEGSLEEASADAPLEGTGSTEAGTSEENVSETDEAATANERQYRQIYETRFHPLPTDARLHHAKTAHGADLMALCFDAEPRVIAAIVENASATLEHMRLIAAHHRTSTGLETMTRRAEVLRDALTERRLLRNPQAGDTVLTRVFASKRVYHSWKIAIDREVPELTRAKARGFVRQKFQKAPPEERADFVLRTEGRCLIMMTGCTFDAKTTSILCTRPFNSVLFIQNLAKFSATPPGLLAHLMKQPFVRKNQPLKKLLLQHPNMPGDMKRQS